MSTVQKTVRIQEKTVKIIADLARMRGVDLSTMINELLSEAVKLRRCPGIVFADGATGRRARVAGSGIDVWEVIATYKKLKKDRKKLKNAYPQLTDQQIRAALAYYAAYPYEIDERVARNEEWTPEKVWEQYPITRPSYR